MRHMDIRPVELWLWLTFLPRMYTIHAIGLTNSAGHTFGSKPYDLTNNDRTPVKPVICNNSRKQTLGELIKAAQMQIATSGPKNCAATNCWWAALLNGGEGWHNNHHAYALSARHGFMWYEVDMVWYGIYLLGCLGVLWDVRVVSEEAIAFGRKEKDSKISAPKKSDQEGDYSPVATTDDIHITGEGAQPATIKYKYVTYFQKVKEDECRSSYSE